MEKKKVITENVLKEKVDSKPIEMDTHNEGVIEKGPSDSTKKTQKFKLSIRDYVYNISLTFVLYLSFFASGTNFTISGPTISDLALFTNSNEVIVGYVFIFKSFGMAIFCTITGFICEGLIKLSHKPENIFSPTIVKLCFIGIMLILLPAWLIPVITNVWVCVIINMCTGMGFEMILVINSVLIEKIWKGVSSKLVNVLTFGIHLSFGIGALLYPYFYGYIFSLKLSPRNNIALIYWVSFVIILPCTSVILFKSPERKYHVILKALQNNKKDMKDKEKKKEEKIIKKFFTCKSLMRSSFVLICALMMFSYVSLDSNMGFLGFVYATKNGFEKETASLLSSFYYGFYTIGRFVCVILSIFMKPIYILVINCIGILFTLILFAIFPTNVVVIWIVLPASGFFLSALFAAIQNFPNHFGIEINVVELSIIFFGTAMGNFTPFLTNVFVEMWVPSFAYFSLFFVIVLNLLLVANFILGCVYKAKFVKVIKQVQKTIEVKEHVTMMKEVVKE